MRHVARIFGFPADLPWEFLTDKPIRAAVPILMFQGLPMYGLRWIWKLFMGVDAAQATPPAWMVFYVARAAMFVYSLAADAAIFILVSKERRRVAMLLYASSWSTLAMQTHTFSNSIETITLLWTLVAVKELRLRGGMVSGMGGWDRATRICSYNATRSTSFVGLFSLPLLQSLGLGIVSRFLPFDRARVWSAP